MTQAEGLTPRKSVAEVNNVARNSLVTSGTEMVFLLGTGSATAGVAAPETAVEVTPDRLGALGGGTRMSTV